MKPATSVSAITVNLGFLSVLHEPSGFLGGYLVMNNWGRPLEFRLSTAVQPSKVQQVLYGNALEPYLCADLIGKTLVEKTTTEVQLVLVDRQPTLDLRPRVEVPVAWLATSGEPAAVELVARGLAAAPAAPGRGPVLCHPRYPDDVPAVKRLLDGLDASFDLSEPFLRIREAIGEARKMGVTNRAA